MDRLHYDAKPVVVVDPHRLALLWKETGEEPEA